MCFLNINHQFSINIFSTLRILVITKEQVTAILVMSKNVKNSMSRETRSLCLRKEAGAFLNQESLMQQQNSL